MNICIYFLKKTFWNHTENGTTEPQDKFLCFEKGLNLAPSSPMTSWFGSPHALSELTHLWCVSSVLEYKNIMFLK